MGMQGELFVTEPTGWVDRVWPSIPTAIRQEIIAILAKMGKATIEGNVLARGGTDVGDG